MKIFITVSCLLAVATAYNYPSYASYHVPVIGPHGVPVDEPAVQHARAEHLAAHHEASLQSGHGYYASPLHYASHEDEHQHGYASHYHGPLHYPKIGHNGVPIDEPAVQAARAKHLAAHHETSLQSGHGYYASPLHYASHEDEHQHGYASHYHGPLHYPKIGHNGVPIDEPAVQVARAHHLAAVAKAQHGDVAVYNYANQYSSINHDVPHDTPEVAHAKAAHFAAHAEAQARNGDNYHYDSVHYRHRRSIPTVYYSNVHHLPVIGPHGVPQDEPAVAHLKAKHAAAHLEATIRNGNGYVSYNHHDHGHYSGPLHYPVIGKNGVPVDEPAVQIARAHHAAAHHEAESRHGYLHSYYPLVNHW